MPAGKSLGQCLERGRHKRHHHTGITSPQERALALTVFRILKSHQHKVGGSVSESPPPLCNVCPSSLEGGGAGQLRSE